MGIALSEKRSRTGGGKVTELTKCRICKGTRLEKVLDLGFQELTGVFPKNAEQVVTMGKLDLVWCSSCGLLQMNHNYPLSEMYGDNYGYRSGLNQSMVDHLTNKIHMLERLAKVQPGDMVVDIGSNDCTSLKAYTVPCIRIGIDPTGGKFSQYYPKSIYLLADFFSAEKFKKEFGVHKRAKVITSIAMFYDLEDPNVFVQDVREILAPDGIWHLEQSYMPAMLRQLAYDTVCHEHLEYYSFEVIRDLMEKNRMRVIDVQTNSINGGSFAVTVCHDKAPYKSNTPVIEWMSNQEWHHDFGTHLPYRQFELRVAQHKVDLMELLNSLVDDGKLILGYGASTKGNVMLQYCGITKKHIPAIADVNPDKFGCVTPGTHIPIISEKEAKEMKPDYFFVFPWHFKQNILEREKDWIQNGGKFIFPLPNIEIV
jgi:hypothetical protein